MIWRIIMTKREDYISWDEYFMGLAKITAMRSKDPSRQVGCCIVNTETKQIVSLGYNGFPRGCSDDEFPWGKESPLGVLETKHPFVVHAELNAILNANQPVRGCTMYVTSSPCNECGKAIIQSGINRIVFCDDYKPGSETSIAFLMMANAAGIEVERYQRGNKHIEFIL